MTQRYQWGMRLLPWPPHHWGDALTDLHASGWDIVNTVGDREGLIVILRKPMVPHKPMAPQKPQV